MGRARTRPQRIASFDEAGPTRTPAPRLGETMGSRLVATGIIQPPFPYTPGAPQSGPELLVYCRAACHPIVKTCLDIHASAAFASSLRLTSRNTVESWKRLDDRIMRSLDRQIDNLLDDGLDGVGRSFLRSGQVYGLAFGELVYGRSAEGWDVVRVKAKSPAWVNLYTDANDNLASVYWLPNGQYLNDDQLLNVVYAPYPTLMAANVYGTSELQAVLQELAILDIIDQYRVKGVAGLMVNPVIAHYAEGFDRDALTLMMDDLATLDSGSFLALPMTRKVGPGQEEWVKAFEFEVLDSRASAEGLKATEAVIAQHERRIMRALSIPDDLGATTAAGGSYAKAQTEAATVFGSKVAQNRSWIERVMTRYVLWPMLRYNFPDLPDAYQRPILTFEGASEDWASDKIGALKQHLELGAITIQEYQERAGLPVMTEDEKDDASLWTPSQAYELIALNKSGLVSDETLQAAVGLPVMTDEERAVALRRIAARSVSDSVEAPAPAAPTQLTLPGMGTPAV